jgi:hypothetical protein
MMIQDVLPAIRRKFPLRDKSVVIQQDGAGSHIKDNDPAFCAAAGTQGLWNISLTTPPARSPDVNHFDLVFFRSLQSAQ